MRIDIEYIIIKKNKKMKIKYLSLLVLCIMTFFSSCSKDDNENGIGGENLIYGTWQLTWEEGYESGEKYSEAYSYLCYYHFDSKMNFAVYRKDKDTGKWEKYKLGTYTIDASNEIFRMNKDDYTLLTLTSNTLKIKDVWEYYGKQEYQIQTFKKVNDSVLPNLE